jgi:RNA polymerase sigma-70 factor (ECF subfamily)
MSSVSGGEPPSTEQVVPAQTLSFRRVALEHQAFIRRKLAQLGVRACDLEDVAQEVLSGMEKGLPMFDPVLATRPESALRAWLFGICERQAASHRRAERKRAEVALAAARLDLHPTGEKSAEERLLEREQEALVSRLLASLEPARRTVFVATCWRAFRWKRSLFALDLRPNTAWNRLRLAREDLQAAGRRWAARNGES